MTFVDLFCGVGGFHVAASQADPSLRCVLASDIDPVCQRVYEANHGIRPVGDIGKLTEEDVPSHDLLFAGFPCQPFSIIGGMKGFEDTRGTLFFEIARILESHRPRAFILENVKMLAGHQGGRTLSVILETLRRLGYRVDWKVLNALDYGLAQKRERIFIVGSREDVELTNPFVWPSPSPRRPSLAEVLEQEVSSFYWASEEIRARRSAAKQKDREPTIWHENKSGSIGKHPFSCALRAGASYNYLLVDGERRLTEREMLRLQGFPEWFQIQESYTTVRRLTGNSVPVPVVEAVLRQLLHSIIGEWQERNPLAKSSARATSQR